ncbi:MAG: hypothetical protein ISS41_10960 [Candidatus Aminicenantes bacterium]|nr:hypothetical protein [Candidatus Aminicenantes bacterium]
MIKKAIFVCVLIFLLMFCLNLTSFGLSTKPAEESAGHALLDSLVVTFKELAEQREEVLRKTNEALISMMKEAKKARGQGQIDSVFFKRYHRILMVLKCVIIEVPAEDAGIMKPLYFGAINKFIEDIEGEPSDIEKAGGKAAIAKFTQAVSHELIELRIYLDNKEKREELIKEYQEFLAISKDIPDLAEKDRQLMSMKDIATINWAISDYVTDFGVPPKQEGTYDKQGEFDKTLSPFYIKVLPVKDKWGNGFRVYSGKACNGVYEGIKGCTDKDTLIISYGRDGKKENWKYNPKSPEAGLYKLKSEKDYDKDLVMLNGTWIRAPGTKKK